MTERRQLLKSTVDTVTAAGSKMAHAEHAAAMKLATTPGQMPDVLVTTHEGKVARFYSELIGKKVVMLNFMSIDREEKFPISRRVAKIAAELGPKLGREVEIISITSDPDRDTPERLAAFHKEMGGHKGWTFVSTPSQSANSLAQRFYRHGRDVTLGGRMDLIQYGNAKVGLWAAFPWDIQVRDAAERITWVMPREVVPGEMRRAGPRQLAGDGPRWNNRKA